MEHTDTQSPYAEPPHDEAPQRLGPPWEQPERGNVLQRAWQTLALVVSQPKAFFADMRLRGGLLPPLLFYALVFAPSYLLSLFISLPVDMAMGTTMGESLLAAGFALVLLPFLIPIGLFISAGITHLCLMLLGGANQGFEATFRVNGYAYGGLAWTMVIPVCGGLVFLVWGIVLEIIGLADAHRVSTGKAAAAVLIPLAIVFLLAVCVAVVFGVALVAMFSN